MENKEGNKVNTIEKIIDNYRDTNNDILLQARPILSVLFFVTELAGVLPSIL